MTTDQWQVNNKDGKGWQDIDAEAVALDVSDATDLDVDGDEDICAIDTGHAKYRKVKRHAAPLATPIKVQIEEDGNCLWAIV